MNRTVNPPETAAPIAQIPAPPPRAARGDALLLAVALGLAGCVPTGGGGSPPEPEPAPPGDPPATIPPEGGDSELLRCSTAAFLDEDSEFSWRPFALRLALPVSGGAASVTLAFAHTYGNEQDPFPFTPQVAEEQASVVLDEDGLRVEADGFDVVAAPWPGSALLWSGTLTHPEHGELAVACWRDDAAGAFRYAPSVGRCVDADGNEGHNVVPVAYLRDARDGHCADLSGLNLHEEDFGYPDLGPLDLRGALLDQATLHFANIYDARWEGADLATFEFGYAYLSGTADAFTRLRTEACDASDPGVVDCMR